MDISQQIDAVYRRALFLRHYGEKSPIQNGLLEQALNEIYFVLEELQISQEELYQQNQKLTTTQHVVELERQRYQTLFEFAPNGYVVTDLQGNIQQVNHYAATVLLRTSPEYLVNKPLLVFIPESDRPRFHDQLAAYQPGERWEVVLNHQNGIRISVAISVTRIKEPQKQRDSLLWSLHDITLRKEMEQQLQSAHDLLEQRVAERTAELVEANTQLQQEINERQQAEQKIREQAALIDIATDAIFVQDLDRHIVFWSQGAEQIYGWPASAMVGNTPTVLYTPENLDQLHVGFALTLEQGSWQAELDQITYSREPIVVSSRWNLVRDQTGQPQSILIVNTDITDKKQLEAQFYRAQRIESLGTLATSIVHDFSNVLTPILGGVELQLAQNPEGKSLELYHLIKNSALRGLDLIQQIKQFAQGSSGKYTPLHPENILLDVTNTLFRAFPETIQMITDIPAEPVNKVTADPIQLYQVIVNLCVNAQDAMPNGGTLTLAIANCWVDVAQAQKRLTARIGHYVMISVTDTGIGIPAASIERIFEPFFTTKASSQGMGLGLSTVFRIVKNHGGFIELESEEGQGTQFRVYLPAITET